MAQLQLQLIKSEKPWKLDEQTIRAGRAGLAQARGALEARYKANTFGDDVKSQAA